MEMRLALLGCGNVGQALISLLARKDRALQERYGLRLTFGGAMTRSAGGWIAANGVSAAALAVAGWPRGPLPQGAQPFTGDTLAFIRACPAETLVELTTLDPHTGQPALDYARAALVARRNVVTANKGPIAHGYRELLGLAAGHGVRLRFESTVMDGTPIFGIAEAALPVTEVERVSGVLNSTSNYILWLMARGQSLDDGIAAAQRAGVAEENPSNDLDGWDASVKITVLANVLMGAELRPADVVRDGLGSEAMRHLVAALPAGASPKQVAEAWRERGGVRARARLAALPGDDVFARLRGMETAVRLTTDTMADLTLIEGEGDPGQTAFGVLADLVAIARGAPARGAPARAGGTA